MKNRLLTFIVLTGSIGYAQSVVQSVNSGSLIAANTAVSIGEIVVNPVNPNQSSSGIIGILTTVNSTLEVKQFDVSESITVYPNPTVAKIFFTSQEYLAGKSIVVYDNSGKIVLQTKISEDNAVDLQSLPTGIFLIRFDDQKLKTFKIIKH